jgi:hypothetical protein
MLLLVLGIAFLAEQFALLPAGAVAAKLAVWWPSLLMLFGISLYIRRPRQPWGPMALIAIAALVQAKQLPHGENLNLWAVLGAGLLVVIGGRMLVPKRRAVVPEMVDGQVTPFPAAPPAARSTRDLIDEDVVFGGMRLSNESPAFRGGSVNATFGGVALDLRGAQLAPEGGVLDVTATFSGVKVAVPEGWAVIVTGDSGIGAWQNHVRQTVRQADGTPVLRIVCHPRFGGIEIRN